MNITQIHHLQPPRIKSKRELIRTMCSVKCPRPRGGEDETSFKSLVRSQMNEFKRVKASSSPGFQDPVCRGVRAQDGTYKDEIIFPVLGVILKSVAEGPGSPHRGNRCAESETGEEEILKALEHHQTGEAPTHERAGKSP